MGLIAFGKMGFSFSFDYYRFTDNNAYFYFENLWTYSTKLR